MNRNRTHMLIGLRGVCSKVLLRGPDTGPNTLRFNILVDANLTEIFFYYLTFTSTCLYCRPPHLLL